MAFAEEVSNSQSVSKRSRASCAVDASVSPMMVYPALFTTTSTRPKRSTAFLNAASIASCKVTSSATLRTFCASSARYESAETFRAVATTRLFVWVANRVARAAPMPDEQPVTCRIGVSLSCESYWHYRYRAKCLELDSTETTMSRPMTRRSCRCDYSLNQTASDGSL